MEAISSFAQFMASIWSVFSSSPVPGFGITFSELYLGAFVVLLSIRIVRKLMGTDNNKKE